jgi:hypothetical protein
VVQLGRAGDNPQPGTRAYRIVRKPIAVKGKRGKFEGLTRRNMRSIIEPEMRDDAYPFYGPSRKEPR